MSIKELHLSALWQPLRAVVRVAHGIPLTMRKLQLDQIWVPSQLLSNVLAIVLKPCHVISSPE